ncbi:helix-turn-helix domain-containing protein [Kineococcus sp. SYSU DK006]|uniref:helix-turn-helix domain-containing protein n=1 Tax=Kineococcus sp. SYSU DK006 TaxID=3383127 RepID=UPI003D7CC081
MPRRLRQEPVEGSIAARLEYLFRVVHPQGRGPLTAQEVADKTLENGHPVTASYITQLRRGSKSNPTVDSLRALAEVFNVPVGYFFGEVGEDAGRSSEVRPGPASSLDEGAREASEDTLETLTLAERINRLFDVRRDAEGNQYSLRQVCAAVQDMGVTLSVGYLSALRRGEKDDPTISQLRALATVFGVNANYFLGDEESVDRIDAKLSLMQAIQKHPEVTSWATRSLQMSPREIRMITRMIEAATTDPDDAMESTEATGRPGADHSS